MIQNLDTLLAMRRQEVHYAKRDFLQHEFLQNRCCDIDIECRNKMCEWLYQTIDFCQFNRETVEIAMSYLDRFLLTPAGVACAMQDRIVYQLACMTALYTAVKIHEREILDTKIISELSRGAYTVTQIEEMEATILSALEWRVNPPTAQSFVREFLALLPNGTLTLSIQETIMTLTAAQIECAVSHFPFLTTAPSTIAYCAFINALEATGSVKKESVAFIGSILAHVLDMDAVTVQVESVHDYLYPICLTSAAAAACTQPSPPAETVVETSSSATTEVKIRVHMHESPRAVTNRTC